MSDAPHIDLGKQTSTIQVRISYRIIELFSEGLYSSPNKAVEELVSNAFDAGASNVHIVLSPDRTIEDAFIAVVDDGIAMAEISRVLKPHGTGSLQPARPAWNYELFMRRSLVIPKWFITTVGIVTDCNEKIAVRSKVKRAAVVVCGSTQIV
jgi:hypothetical protein